MQHTNFNYSNHGDDVWCKILNKFQFQFVEISFIPHMQNNLAYELKKLILLLFWKPKRNILEPKA